MNTTTALNPSSKLITGLIGKSVFDMFALEATELGMSIRVPTANPDMVYGVMERTGILMFIGERVGDTHFKLKAGQYFWDEFAIAE